MSKKSKCPISEGAITALALGAVGFALIAPSCFREIEFSVCFILTLAVIPLSIAAIVVAIVHMRSARQAEWKKTSVAISVFAILLGLAALYFIFVYYKDLIDALIEPDIICFPTGDF